jgi:hypothetical protein
MLNDIADVYRDERQACLGIARRFVSPSEAEDALHDVTLTLVRRRRRISPAALGEYFRHGTNYAALRMAMRARGVVLGVGGGAELDLAERRAVRMRLL